VHPSSPDDDGFREIQLNFKQLVFLFMAATVVLVVTFLAGLMAGRGVRMQREEAAQAEALTESPAAPPEPTPGPTSDAAEDPRNAAPPPAAEDGEVDAAAAQPQPIEEPPVAVKRSAPADASVETAKKAASTDVKAAEAARPAAPRASAPPPPAQSAPTAAAAAPPAAPAAETPVPTGPARSGYAVQVAAVNARGEADAIARRLSGKGYSAYVEVPKGRTSVFRVRVGTFRTRREAQTIADRLQKEEKFKPWVTR
jgi:cell division septation protein DedD